ncbi:MAG: aminoglycoside phosphotransferase family protein [Bacteroidales bacterium]
MDKLKKIISEFQIDADECNISPFGTGLINDTYKVTAGSSSYILQRINHSIFKDVELMQNNIFRVTGHIKSKGAMTLSLIPTKDGKLYYFSGTEYWRVTRFIENSKSFEQVTPNLAYLTGEAFGNFQLMLADLPGEPLGYTIPDFHNMEFRLEQLKEALALNKSGRLKGENVKKLAGELLSRAELMCKAERLGREGKLPRRITHCDTKVNNMLFDQNGNFLCVIDLDTTMPGFVLSDFGDFIRTAGNTAAEDEPDTSKIGIDMDIFRAFAKGYLHAAKAFLTPIEIENLPYGAKLLTYMQTVRFFTDYINGDTYYKIKYPNHNWVRTIAQFTLLQSMEQHEAEMNEYIASLR